MSNSPEKNEQAVQQLDALIADLRAAEEDLSGWEKHDLHRRDGSSAQDARHEGRGRAFRDRVWTAKQKVEQQKNVVEDLGKEV